jgi:hypothetical protein
MYQARGGVQLLYGEIWGKELSGGSPSLMFWSRRVADLAMTGMGRLLIFADRTGFVEIPWQTLVAGPGAVYVQYHPRRFRNRFEPGIKRLS